jgi:hypothetical protein
MHANLNDLFPNPKTPYITPKTNNQTIVDGKTITNELYLREEHVDNKFGLFSA